MKIIKYIVACILACGVIWYLFAPEIAVRREANDIISNGVQEKELLLENIL